MHTPNTPCAPSLAPHLQPVWQPVSPHTYGLAESPFWHPMEGRLYWVDIPGKLLLRCKVTTGSVDAWAMPSEPGCIAPAARGGLVIALRDGIYRAKEWGGALSPIGNLGYDSASVRANDGKCDALGRFWVGTIDEPKAGSRAGLYMVDARGPGAAQVVQKAANALTANGLAWSPDGGTLYWADTPNHVVHAWDFSVSDGALSGHRHYLEFAKKPSGWSFSESLGYLGRPDGAAVDSQGNYYSALFEGAQLGKFAPDGTLLATLATPAQCPTMPCFGGEDRKTLYITSARHGRSAAELALYPLSGAIFSTRVEVPGLPVNLFQEA